MMTQVRDNVKNTTGSAYGQNTIKPPDGDWGWVVTFSSFIHNALIDGICLTVGVFYLEFMDYFNGSNSKTQMISSAVNGTYLLSGIVASLLVAKYGCRRVTVCGAIVSSVGLFLSTFSPNLETMIVLYGVVVGFGFGLTYLPAIVVVGLYFEKKRALATGIAVCGSGMGNFVFAPLSSYLIREYGCWKGAVWILSGIVLNGVIFAITYRPLTPPVAISSRKQTTDEKQLSHGSHVSLSEKTVITDEKRYSIPARLRSYMKRSPLSNKAFLLYTAAISLCGTGFFIPFGFLPAFALSVNLSANDGALIVAVTGISNTASRVLSGLISDRPWADPIHINNIALFVGGTVTCFVPYYKTFGLLVFYAVLIGACLGTNVSLRSIITTELLGTEKLANAYGLWCMFEGVCVFVGSPIAGALVDTTEDYSAAFYFSGLTIGLAGLIGFPLRMLSQLERKKTATNDNKIDSWDSIVPKSKFGKDDFSVLESSETLDTYM